MTHEFDHPTFRLGRQSVCKKKKSGADEGRASEPSRNRLHERRIAMRRGAPSRDSTIREPRNRVYIRRAPLPPCNLRKTHRRTSSRERECAYRLRFSKLERVEAAREFKSRLLREEEAAVETADMEIEGWPGG